ncbi:hypothetical protein [Butyrivibrio sp. JL13D10]|uniref:hypothetical protein n=1 Tax=Butyrivibrio sp. JL13D10 TaxID=3236815 RepID=UPI0038B430D6
MAKDSKGFGKAQEYLKRHLSLKRWSAIMLVVAILITTATLYAMNKAASAVSEEGADEIGMVLEENSGEGSENGNDGVIFADTEEYAEEEQDDYSEESEENYEESAESEESENYEDNSDSEEYTDSVDYSEETTETENQDETIPEDQNDEEAYNTENPDALDEEADVTEEESEEESEEADDEITQDIILKVSYVDADGEIIKDNNENAYADEMNVVLDEDVDINENAPYIEGYELKSIKSDDLEIKKIEVRKYVTSDDSEYTYYEFVSENMPSYEGFTQDEDGNYISEIKEDADLVFIFEKTEAAYEETEDESQDSEEQSDEKEDSEQENAKDAVTEEEKIAEENIPESVDLSKYVTETVIERLKEDGTWEEIAEEDIKEGDHLRITMKYSMPEEASLSDDIHMDVPKQYGNVISSQSDLEDGNGTFEATEDNKIIINYSDEYKKEKIADSAEPAEKNEENNGKSDDARIKQGGSSTSALLGLLNPIVDFFDGFSIVAHAANDDNRNASGTLTYETIVDSTDSGNMKITGVSVRKNPTIRWNAGKKEYTGGTPIESGAEVNNGEGLIFTLEYILAVGTVSKEKPSITYALSKHGINVNEATSGFVYNGNNEEVGTFTIDENSVVTITFHEEFAEKNRTNIIDDSFFFFYATAMADGDKERTEKIYDFGNDVTFTIFILNKVAPDLSLKKKILEDYNEKTGTIKYQITMSSENGSGTDIQFKDFPEVYYNEAKNKDFSQELSNEITLNNIIEYSIVKQKKDKTTVQPSVTGTNSSNLVFEKLGAGESYIITYTLKVPEKIATSSKALRLKNYAEANFGNSEKRDAAVYTDFFGDIPTIFKDGSVNADKREVTWTITLNEGHANLKGYTLSDVIYKFGDSGWNQVTTPYKGVLTVYSVETGNGQSRGTFVKDSELTLGEKGYTFTQDDYSKYVFKYTYKYTDKDLVYGNLKNEARIYLDDNTTGNKYNRTKWVGNPQMVDKTAEGVSSNGDGTVTLSWKVTLNAPLSRNAGKNNSEYWVFYETVTDDKEVFTSSDVEKLKSAIGSVYKGRYSLTTENSKKIGKLSGYKSIEIKFYQDIETTVSFDFTTTGSVGEGNGTVQFTNKAAAYNKDVYGKTATQTYEPFIKKYDGNFIETESWFDYNTPDTYKQGILTWIIEANIPQNNNYGTLYVVDSLPSDVSIIENGTYNGAYLYGIDVCENNSFSGAAGFEGGQVSYNGVTYSKSVNAGNIVISFDGKAAGGKKIYFRVHAKVSTDYDFAKGSGSFTNNVTLSKDSGGNEKLGSASQTQHVTRTEYAMTKTSQAANGSINTIEYMLDVNPAGADLLEGGDTLTLTDILSAKSLQNYNVYLVPDSAKVFEVKTGDDGSETEIELSSSEYSYTISSYETTASMYGNDSEDKFVYSTIIFKIPDGKHLKVKYRYTFNGDDNATVQLSNEAKLEGIVIDNNSAENSTTVKVQDAGARANVRGINLYKVDADNSGTMLPGAVFLLYYFDGNDWVLQNNEKSGDGKYTTDSSGRVSIAPLIYNVGYKLVEEQAPEGYAKDETPICFYLPSADKDNYPMVIPDNFYTELGGSEFTSGQPVYVGNKKNSTSITIKKDWVNADSVTKPSSIFVKIGRRLGNAETGKDNGKAASGQYYTVNIDRRRANNAMLQYKGFPSVKSGSQLTFTFYTFDAGDYKDLTEVTVNGEKLDYSGELNDSGIQAVTKTITITGNTTIHVKESWAVNNYPESQITASITAQGDNITPADGASGTGGVHPGAEDLGFNKEITITEVDGWKATLTGLDRFYTDEATGTKYEWLYYVSEVGSLYYTASYSENNAQGINDGTITITNTRNDVEAYSLPSTGGNGRLPFTIAGLVLVTVALIGEEYFRRKRRKQ